MANNSDVAAASSAATTPSTSAPLIVYVNFTPKGGAGKTETSECLDAVHTLNGQHSKLIDVDDGNRGLVRRVGADNVVKVEWCTSAISAPDWVARHTLGTDVMIFDMGAGIESTDLPVMRFLKTTWRMLADRGARFIICAVVSTNAPTSNFIDRLERKFGDLGEVVIVLNNQDGSAEYPKEIAAQPQQKLHLAQLRSGVQAVRLSRRERLSNVLRSPDTGYSLASALMARRVLTFANQEFFKGFSLDRASSELRSLAREAPTHFRYAITNRSLATDEIIRQNAELARAESVLLSSNLTDMEILKAAANFRLQHFRYSDLLKAERK